MKRSFRLFPNKTTPKCDCGEQNREIEGLVVKKGYTLFIKFVIAFLIPIITEINVVIGCKHGTGVETNRH